MKKVFGIRPEVSVRNTALVAFMMGLSGLTGCTFYCCQDCNGNDGYVPVDNTTTNIFVDIDGNNNVVGFDNIVNYGNGETEYVEPQPEPKPEPKPKPKPKPKPQPQDTTTPCPCDTIGGNKNDCCGIERTITYRHIINHEYK